MIKIKSKTILVVEDELAYSNLLKAELENEDYKVITARNGILGLETAIQNHPDLILLDIRMPKMDGITMLSKLRKDAYGAHAKVIMLTNFEPDNHIIRNLVENEPIYYCIKSDTPLKSLLDRIQNLLFEPADEVIAA